MAILLSPEFWVALLTLVGTIVGFLIKRKLQRDVKKEQTEKRQSAEDQLSDALHKKWADQTGSVNEAKRKQDDALEKWSKEEG
jgi:hypothetical protein